MWLAAALIASFAGWAALALAMERHHRRLWRQPPGQAKAIALRVTGTALLALAFAACVMQWNGSLGAVAWFGVLSASGLAFIFSFGK